jgi:transposase
MELFDERVMEVEKEGIRYVLRRNPHRVEDMARTRRDKRASVEALLQKRNAYLSEHPRAHVKNVLRDVRLKIERLRIGAWMKAEVEGRTVRLRLDDAALAEESRLDGCYVIKSDVPREAADAQTIHDRYKDLAQVEQAFRTCKTAHLEVRPVFVRSEASTRGHVLVVMLAYLIVRQLQHAWSQMDVTVEEGLKLLSTLCTMEIVVKGQQSCHCIPTPREISSQMLKAADIHLPQALPRIGGRVVTRKKLPIRRLTR